jgi:hypothetical protein
MRGVVYRAIPLQMILLILYGNKTALLKKMNENLAKKITGTLADAHSC